MAATAFASDSKNVFANKGLKKHYLELKNTAKKS